MTSILRRLVVMVCILSAMAETALGVEPAAVSAAAFQTDTVASYSFRAERLAVPLSLIAVGSLGASNGWARLHIDRNVDNCLGSSSKWNAADYLEFVPYAASFGLGFVVPTQYSVADRALLAATSFVLLEAVTQPVKRIVRRERPDFSDRHSFPSGHTATAFAGAELCRLQYGWGYGAAAYTVAVGVAAMRMAGRHHWLSDCVTGAGIGILSARAAAWLLPFERRLFGLKSSGSPGSSAVSASVVPCVMPGGAGIAACISL